MSCNRVYLGGHSFCSVRASFIKKTRYRKDIFLNFWWGQTKGYKTGICCFSTKNATLRRKSKDWLALNQDNVSEWGDMSIRRLLFQWASTIKIQLSVLV